MIFRRKDKDENPGTPPVIIVDDEADVCNLIALALRPRGYRPITHHDGESGLLAMRREKPLAVVLDIMMPGMNGYQVLAEMQRDEVLRDVPVIVLTSLTQEDGVGDDEWARRLEVARFISKPFDPDLLVDLIAEVAGPPQPNESS